MRQVPHAGRGPSGEKSTPAEEETTMFLQSDPQIQLDIYHQRTDELIRQATEYRLARTGYRRPRKLRRRHA
jgi:hypothetical protein